MAWMPARRSCIPGASDLRGMTMGMGGEMRARLVGEGGTGVIAPHFTFQGRRQPKLATMQALWVARRQGRGVREATPPGRGGKRDRVGQAQGWAAETTAAKAAGSRTARSASILRLMRMSAAFRSWISRL